MKIRALSIIFLFTLCFFSLGQTAFAQADAVVPAQQDAQAGTGTQEQVPGAVVNDAINIPLLFVQSMESGTFDGKELVLKGVDATIYFSDRPFRIAGHVPNDVFIADWDKGENNFKEDPPNAALSIFNSGGQPDGAVIELRDAELRGEDIVYQVKVMNGDLPAEFQAASIFIDSKGDAGWGAAGGLLGGLLLGKVLDSSSHSQPQTTVIQTAPPPPYYYSPPPYYGYAPQPYYGQPQQQPQPPPYYGEQRPPQQQQY